MRPHRRQPTRLPRRWDSPGKNTGVGCHFLLQCMKVKSEREVAQSCLTLHDPLDCSPPGSSVHGIFKDICYILFLMMLSYLGETLRASEALSEVNLSMRWIGKNTGSSWHLWATGLTLKSNFLWHTVMSDNIYLIFSVSWFKAFCYLQSKLSKLIHKALLYYLIFKAYSCVIFTRNT